MQRKIVSTLIFSLGGFACLVLLPFKIMAASSETSVSSLASDDDDDEEADAGKKQAPSLSLVAKVYGLGAAGKPIAQADVEALLQHKKAIDRALVAAWFTRLGRVVRGQSKHLSNHLQQHTGLVYFAHIKVRQLVLYEALFHTLPATYQGTQAQLRKHLPLDHKPGASSLREGWAEAMTAWQGSQARPAALELLRLTANLSPLESEGEGGRRSYQIAGTDTWQSWIVKASAPLLDALNLPNDKAQIADAAFRLSETMALYMLYSGAAHRAFSAEFMSWLDLGYDDDGLKKHSARDLQHTMRKAVEVVGLHDGMFRDAF